jgi:fructose-bisphosphate aldolase class II
VAFTVPAARAWGYDLTVDIVADLARHHGTDYALHLDHAEDPDEIRAAVNAGFTSANYLDEGATAPGAYLPAARSLRNDVAGRASLEFVLGTLGHIDDDTHHHGHATPRTPTVHEVEEFVDACTPDIVGFECGSLHGMRARERDLDIELIAAVAHSTALPIVLHGSSGVTPHALRAGVDAGIRKINVETAVRAAYLDTVRTCVNGDGDAARKPRHLTRATDAALHETFTRLLSEHTRPRKASS